MKNTLKYSSRLALGIVAVALLTSVRLTPAPARFAHDTVALKRINLNGILVAGGGGGDGQESNGGGKGKTKG